MPIPAVSTISALVLYDGVKALLHIRNEKRNGNYISDADAITNEALALLNDKSDPEKHIIEDSAPTYSQH